MGIDYNQECEVFCTYCNKKCHSKNSLKQHEIRCALNPNRRLSENNIGNRTKGRVPWNKGLTKETDQRVASYGNSISIATKGRTGHPISDEQKQLLRELALDRGLGGFNMRNKGISHNGVKLDSTYEMAVAKSLDEHSIEWARCERFSYHAPDGELHYYTPDFYLPKYNVYLDPKNDFLINNINPSLGYKDVDKIQWVMNENDISIFILDKNHLTWDKIYELIF